MCPRCEKFLILSFCSPCCSSLRSVICFGCGCCFGITPEFSLDPRLHKEAWLDGRAPLILADAPRSSALASAFVADVGGVSVVFCSCCYSPGSPSEIYSVVVDRVGFFWTASHGCEVVPIGEVPPWWEFRRGFHEGPRVIHITRAR